MPSWVRCFTSFLVLDHAGVDDVGQSPLERAHGFYGGLAGGLLSVEVGARPWVELGTLRMFFVRIDEWSWPEAPARVPRFDGDLPRLDHLLPKALDDSAAAKLLRAARADRKPLVGITVEVDRGLYILEYTGP